MFERPEITSGIIEQYVLGLCSPEEMLAVEKLRQEDPLWENAIRAFEEKWEEQSLQMAVNPGGAADKKIIDLFGKLQPTNPVIEKTTAKVVRFSYWKAAAVFMGIALLASVYYNYRLWNQQKELANVNNSKPVEPVGLPGSDYAVLRNPAITPVAMMGVGIHSICRCTLFWDKNTGKVYIMIHHLPRTGAKTDFNLWAMVDNKPVNIGIVQDDIRDRFIEISGVSEKAISFIVTLENAGKVDVPNLNETYLKGEI